MGGGWIFCKESVNLRYRGLDLAKKSCKRQPGGYNIVRFVLEGASL